MASSTFFLENLSNKESIQFLESSLLGLEGVERALIDTEDGELKIEYNDKEIELLAIVNHIEEYGFQIAT